MASTIKEIPCKLNTECANKVKSEVIPVINLEADGSAEKFAGNTCDHDWTLCHVKKAFWKENTLMFSMNIENKCGHYMACSLAFEDGKDIDLMCINDSNHDHIH